MQAIEKYFIAGLILIVVVAFSELGFRKYNYDSVQSPEIQQVIELKRIADEMTKIRVVLENNKCLEEHKDDTKTNTIHTR